ncbi:MAG: hypothetical protein R2778_11885 [Saprospiraceae bacterium]
MEAVLPTHRGETTTQTAGIKAVPLPTNIASVKISRKTTVILNDWLRNPATQPPFDTVSIYKHAWGIWAGLCPIRRIIRWAGLACV